MKKGVLIILLSSITIQPFFAKELKAYFTYCTFTSPDKGPYIETYITVLGNTVEYRPNNAGKLQGNIEITMYFKQGEEIKNFKKYSLLSPELEDTTSGFVDFIDQQRLALPNGKYEFEIQIKDANSTSKPFTSFKPVEINFPKDQVVLSDIELIESYQPTVKANILSKSGYDLVPYVSNYIPENMAKLAFYTEVYNTDKILGSGEKYLVNYFIRSNETGVIRNDLRGFKRQTTQVVNVVLGEFQIKELPSGNYDLVVELRNRNNEIIISKELFFQRSNPSVEMELEDLSTTSTFVEKYTHIDTLKEFINCLRPVSSQVEFEHVKKRFKENPDLQEMQQYFLHFWLRRNALDPEGEWLRYQAAVQRVQENWGSRVFKGYETDRGRVFLKYGEPNSINSPISEPSSYPYEIWHYYSTKKRKNAKFVFYNPSLVGENYVLLHSNVFGEPNDYRWQLKLHKRNTQFMDLDVERGREHYGSQAEDLYNNPR